MPCRISYDHCPRVFGHHDSFQSLFLCLIWLVTTHGGSHDNEKRIWDYGTSEFNSTEISQWNKKLGVDADPDSKQLWNKKMLVMLSQIIFEERILSYVHSHFKKQKLFLQALRALIYDPQWAETRRLLADPDTADSDRRRRLDVEFISIIDDAGRLNESGLRRALGKPSESEKATSAQAGWYPPPFKSVFVFHPVSRKEADGYL